MFHRPTTGIVLLLVLVLYYTVEELIKSTNGETAVDLTDLSNRVDHGAYVF